MKPSLHAPTTAEMAEFMADDSRQMLTFPGGGSISKMTPEDEMYAYLDAQRPHLAVLERKDGVVHMEAAPDAVSAGRALLRLIDRGGGIGGAKFKRAYVRAR
jgi:hypothetical protein